MSLQHHTLTAGGVTQTLAAWGIVACTCTHKLGGEDQLQFTISGDISTNSFAVFATVALRSPDGVLRFFGILTKPSRRATGRSQSRTYVAESPSYYLRRLVYRQKWWFVTNPADFADVATIKAELAADPISLAAHFGRDWSSQVILNQLTVDASYGTLSIIDLHDQVQDILNYAINEGGAPIAYDLTHLPATVRPPTNQQTDLRCSDAVRNQLDWLPHINWRWEYRDDGLPLMRFGDCTAYDDFLVAGQESASRTLDVTGAVPYVIEFQGDPQWDQLSPGMEITYIYGTATVDPEDPTTYANVRGLHRDTATASPANGSFGFDRITVILQGDVSFYLAGQPYLSNGEPVPPDGLAAAMLTAYARPYYELKFSTHAPEVDWTAGVGERWSVAGATSDYTAAQAVCQSITRDIGAGLTTWQCGPPSELAFQARLELLRANRLRKLGQDSGSQQYGFGPAKDAGTPPALNLDFLTFVDVDICKDDGSSATLHVATRAGS